MKKMERAGGCLKIHSLQVIQRKKCYTTIYIRCIIIVFKKKQKTFHCLPGEPFGDKTTIEALRCIWHVQKLFSYFNELLMKHKWLISAQEMSHNSPLLEERSFAF